MVNFDDFRELKKLKTYESSNDDCLISCQSATGRKFIAVLVDCLDDGRDVWLYSPVSDLRLKAIENGSIDLYDAFKNTEEGFLFCMIIGNNRVSLCKASVDDVPNDGLPLRNTFLKS